MVRKSHESQSTVLAMEGLFPQLSTTTTTTTTSWLVARARLDTNHLCPCRERLLIDRT